METLFITKKTHLTTQPLGKKVPFVKFETDDIGKFLSDNRRNIINLKDCLLNREKLSPELLRDKIDLISDVINGKVKLPEDFVEPVGIKTSEQIKARHERELAQIAKAEAKKLEKTETVTLITEIPVEIPFVSENQTVEPLPEDQPLPEVKPTIDLRKKKKH